MEIKIAPSILSADFGRLNEEIQEVDPYADMIHVDVMDGHFVPNITLGAPVVKKIKSALPLDCHLMIQNPKDYIQDFADAGANIITIHEESEGDLKELIAQIKATGCKAGVSIKPKTPLSVIEGVLPEIDMLLIMSVEPGFGGQSFMSEVLEKSKECRSKYPDLDIQIDGGINADTAKEAIAAGCNILVAGSYIFGKEDRAAAIASLRP